MLARIQNDLFDLGADLCVPGQAGDRLRLNDAPGARLETEIAVMNANLAPLHQLHPPRRHAGGGARASRPHRHPSRRTRVVRLAAEEAPEPALVRYLNRLSDHRSCSAAR